MPDLSQLLSNLNLHLPLSIKSLTSVNFLGTCNAERFILPRLYRPSHLSPSNVLDPYHTRSLQSWQTEHPLTHCNEIHQH